MGSAIAREGIECEFHHGGSLIVAQSDAQLERLRRKGEERRALGAHWELIGAADLAERLEVGDGRGALFTPHCARVHPARLVAGLAAAAERAGVRIHERSRVTGIRGRAGPLPAQAETEHGTVRADTVVVAVEGYTADLPGRHRRLLPLNSAMIATEPLPAATWERIGWSNAETVLDGSHLFTYSQRTADGRIAIGGRGVPYRYGSRTDREGPVPPATVAQLRARLGELVPAAAAMPVARAWAGVLGVARDWCPAVGHDPRSGLAWAGGYAGEGVAASNLAARTLRDLMLERETDLTTLPWVGAGARDWEPEPLRFLAARGIHRLYGWADRREARTGRPSPLAKLANAVAGR
jgi:glycine/D-amino acid oxidase-like deaminating enzyme